MSQVVARRLLATTPRAERVIRVSANSIAVREGETATLRVRLSSRPRTGQTVTVAATSNDVTEATVSPGSRQFSDSNWGDWQDFTVAGVQDADGNDENTTISLAASGGGYDDSAGVSVTVEDDENKGLRLSDMSLTVGGTVTSRTIGVRLRTEPTGNVDVGASVTGALVSVSPASRRFTTSNWNEQQLFTVNLDDTTGSGASTLALDPSGADYAAVATVNVPITIEASLPGEVTNVMATTRKHERLTIGWNAASLATSYEFRFKKATASNWMTRTGLTSTSQTERELDPSTSYDVQVRGVNAAGNGPWSTSVRVSTLTGNRQTIQLPSSRYSSHAEHVLWAFPRASLDDAIDLVAGLRGTGTVFWQIGVGRTTNTPNYGIWVSVDSYPSGGGRFSSTFESSGTIDLTLSTGESVLLRMSENDQTDFVNRSTSFDRGADGLSVAEWNTIVGALFGNTQVGFAGNTGTKSGTLILRDYSPD